MYSASRIAAREEQLLQAPALRRLYPTGSLPRYSIPDTRAITAQIQQSRDQETGEAIRALTAEESRFVAVTQLRVIFDAPYYLESFCNTEEAPIWMADMSVKAIADVRVGESVVGWANLGGARPREASNKVARTGRHAELRDTLTPSIVLAKAERKTAIVRVVLESGRELRCTPDHLWRRGQGSRGGSWTNKSTGKRTQYFYPWTEAKVGRSLCHVIDPASLLLTELTEEEHRLAAWLGGIYDGEGCRSMISQSPTHNPLVYEKIGEALRRLGIAATGTDTGYYLIGGFKNFARFLALTQPHRASSLLPSTFAARFGTPDRVVAVEPAGDATVVSMQTTTGNYTAWGYASKNCWIDEEGHGLRPLYPLWNSQRFALQRLATIEEQHLRDGVEDGILLNILKVRQVGISTLGMGLVSHRIFTQPYIRAIAGSDTEEQARYLFRMVERIYEALPFFLQPDKAVPYSSGRELNLGNKASLKTAWGKTTRGALQSEGGKKGNIERGRTNSVVHISELATWDNPDQLDTSLLPGVPRSSQTLVLFESTAEIAGDWWHRHFLTTGEGKGRFANLFIPWCVKYEKQAPMGWAPNETTLKVAGQIERDSFSWVGEVLRPTKNQLYWYESERAYFAGKNRLTDFFKEFPSNPEECFQYAGRSVFSMEQLEQIDKAARPLLDVWEVQPARDIAALKRLPENNVEATAQLAADRKRYPAPTAPSAPSTTDTLVPAGYGFRRLTKPEVETLPSLRSSVLAIWEYPRLRGRRRYILGVDVGDGLGLDYSVVSVIREPTIEEPAEEVAQYLSNAVKPSELAFIVDAIGHFYTDEDGVEACAAVELNNHGITVQDLLQLHLGYTHFYVWEVVDAADASARFTKRIGWQTTTRTRPILIEKFHDAITTLDPITLVPDLRLNSPITRQELRFFVTEGLMGEAEHAKGQHDDAIFGSAIGYYVAYRLSGGESEPLAERRRRRAHLQRVQLESGTPKPDWRNSPSSADAALSGVDDDGDPDLSDDDDSAVFFDPRRHA